MTEEWAMTRTVNLGKNLSVVMSAGPGGFVCEWKPDMPKALTEKQMSTYRFNRDALLVDVGKRLGGSVLVIET